MQNPWALLALATLVLPWALLRRRRPSTPPPRVVFPALSLLATAKQRRSLRRKELRRLILATLRSVAIISLALTWAAPSSFWPPRSAAAPAEIAPDAPPPRRVADGRIDGRPIRLLVVDGADSGTSTSESPAAFYLAAALNPGFDAARPAESDAFPKVEVVSSSEFTLTPSNALAAFDAICWVDVSAPTAAELEKTERFLAAANGASPRALLVFAGPRTNVSRWNAAWRRWNLDVRTLDVAFNPATGELADATSAADRVALQTVAAVSVKERLFAESFVDFERSGVDSLPIWRAFPLVGDGALPVLRDATSNVPTATRLAAPSQGVVLWFSTAPDAATSSLAFAPSFVPLLDRLVEFALQESIAETENATSCLTSVSAHPASIRASKNRTAVPNETAQEKEKTRQATARTLWFATVVLLAFECWFSASPRFFSTAKSSANRCGVNG